MRKGAASVRVLALGVLMTAGALFGTVREAGACPEGTKVVYFTVTKEIYLFGVHVATILYEEGWECRAT